MNKPVIILGGGVWGSLLAYRLKDALPHIPFKLYEASETLGNQKSCSFNESDCPLSMNWLRPLVTETWNKTHLITSEHLHREVVATLDEKEVFLKRTVSLEEAQKEGSFVIDARNICFFQSSHFRHIYSVEIETKGDHNLSSPILSLFEGLEIFPLSSDSLLINVFESSLLKELNQDHFREKLQSLLSEHSWIMSKISKEIFKSVEVPVSPPHFTQDGRVINLAGILHDINGCSIPTAVTLIDRMVRTSFRFGELREVVKDYRLEIEPVRKFYRLVNRFTNLKLQYKSLMKPLNKTTPKTV